MSNSRSHRRWEDANGNLIIEFDIEIDPFNVIARLSGKLFWKEFPSDLQFFTIDLDGLATPLQFQFASGAQFKGYLKLFSTNDETGIFGDFSFSKPGESALNQHFDGTLILIETENVPIKPIEPIDPIEPKTTSFPNQYPIVQPEQDLFPYVYLRKWPNITQTDLQYQFVQYQPQSISSVFSLYDQLLQIRNSAQKNIRSQIEDAALQFINSSVDFIQKPDDLQPITLLLHKLWSLAQAYPTLSEQAFIDLATETLGLKPTELKAYLISPEYLIDLDRVWQSYFALVIILGYQNELLEVLISIIVMNNLLNIVLAAEPNTINDQYIASLIEASIVLPIYPFLAAKQLFPLPPYDNANPIPLENTIETYAIGELQMVRQTPLRYELGDIAYIENVLKGERKEVSRRKLRRITESNSQQEWSEEMSENDTQEKEFDLLNETNLTLTETILTTDYSNVTVSPAFPPVIGGNWTQTLTPDQAKPSVENISKFAKDVLHKTVNRIAQKINRVRFFSSIDESEETVCSIFDNIGSDRNIRGVYRWLNRVFSARVVNYGNRLIMEFLIPNPAQAFIQGEAQFKGLDFDRPIPPHELPAPATINSWEDITVDNYTALVIRYGVSEVPLPPAASRIVSAIVQNTGEISIPVPQGYSAQTATVSAVFAVGLTGEIQGLVGNNAFNLKNASANSGPLKLNGEDISVPVVVLGNPIPATAPVQPDNSAITIEMVCTPTSETLTKWKLKTYQAIMRGYQEQKVEYYRLSSNRSSAEQKGHNPIWLQRAVRKTLKDDCFRTLYERFQQKVGTEDLQLKPSLDEVRLIQFFEQSFDWKEMSCLYGSTLFNPGNKKAQSIDTFAQNPFNTAFTSFLQATYAQVFVPVLPEYFLPVLYFLRAGMLWTAPTEFCPVHPQDVNLASELKTLKKQKQPEPWESTPWEMTVPTAMLIIDEQGVF